MDGYPTGSLDLNLPYLVVAGLTSQPPNDLPLDPQLQDQGILLRSELPSLETEDAKTLREYISIQDATDQPWSPQDKRPYRYRVRFSGRVNISVLSRFCWRNATPLTFVVAS